MEKHYVVIRDWAENDTRATDIMGIGHSLAEAKDIFEDVVGEEREYAQDHGYTVDEDTDVLFESGIEGSYSDHHTTLYIQVI